MLYKRPFITRRFVAYGGELFGGDTHRHRLALAVQVLDDFTGKQVEVPLRVFLKELRQARPLRKQSGLFCFEDVPSGNYTLVVEPDLLTADWFYLKLSGGGVKPNGFELPVTLPIPQPPEWPNPPPPPAPPWPRLDVTLAPKGTYPFPANATLVRGLVTTGTGNALRGAAGVTVKGKYRQVDPTDSDLTLPKEIETQTDDAGEYVLFFQKLPSRKQAVTVVAVKDGQSLEQEVEIKEGVTTRVDFTTSVRGRVRAGANAASPGVEGVTVSTTYQQISPADSNATVSTEIRTQTDDVGEYVLIFKKIPAPQQSITVTAAKGGKQVQQQIEIIEGVTTKVDFFNFP